MKEYQAARLRLGWLIIPQLRQVEVYTPGGVQTLTSPQTLSGGAVLPGFTLELGLIWNPAF